MTDPILGDHGDGPRNRSFGEQRPFGQPLRDVLLGFGQALLVVEHDAHPLAAGEEGVEFGGDFLGGREVHRGIDHHHRDRPTSGVDNVGHDQRLLPAGHRPPGGVCLLTRVGGLAVVVGPQRRMVGTIGVMAKDRETPAHAPRTLSDGTIVRLLKPGEGATVGTAIRVAYGDTYDAPWVYDADEVDRRLSSGALVSCVATEPDGSLLCHGALTRSTLDAPVAESGQAATLPAARGRHLFTEVKRFLAEWATAEGLFGLFSEATAAHPFSQKANLDLGAHETGFLPGWIPSTVANDAAAPTAESTEKDRAPVGRQSAAIFYLRTNRAHERPLFVPARHREEVARIVDVADMRGTVIHDEPAGSLLGSSVVEVLERDDHNLAVLTVHQAGADLGAVVTSERDSQFGTGRDAVFLDLPMEHPTSGAAGDLLDELGFSFAGLFPNLDVAGDMLRLVAFRDSTIVTHESATASDHGRQLLDYVLADLARQS